MPEQQADSMDSSARGFLDGVRVLEIADELGEYCGKLLAGLGADVIKIEPPGGEITRQYGPFYEDKRDKNRSLYFWHYNFGKRGIVADLDTAHGKDLVSRLASGADVLIDTRQAGYLEARGLGYEDLRKMNPSLLSARISPFGDDGPWANYKGSDLVHLALGGVTMNCGYDAEPSGHFDTPPITPQMWQSYHIAGEMAALGIMAGLNHRLESGTGQRISVAVHDAVSKNSELDLPSWIFCRQAYHRQTARHARPAATDPALAMTKDGRWMMPYRTYLHSFEKHFGGILKLLTKYGMELDLTNEQYRDPEYVAQPAVTMHVGAAVDRLVGKFKFSKGLWREAQAEGMPWAPVHRPEENLLEQHWHNRQTFIDVYHPELNRTFSYVGARWVAPGIPWRKGPRAPMLGEHTGEVLDEIKSTGDRSRTGRVQRQGAPRVSKRGKPFALQGIRIVDLSWMLASGGAGRYFASLGAEVIKIEHSSRPDRYRDAPAMAPSGGRPMRDASTEPLFPSKTSPNRSGVFMDTNSGKRSLSLNLKHPRGKKLLEALIASSDMVIEGFSPGTMERLGLGYERLRQLNPTIIYVQQSGTGQVGGLGSMRTFGPTAQALSGLTDMSGLPEPYPPAGIGYSYLDWFGAYNMASAMMAALYRRRSTGAGCYIDASQVEIGIYLTGTAILDYVVNKRQWSRYGNRSPYKAAAPHGVYPVQGQDRWIAIACFNEEEWRNLVRILGDPKWALDPSFASLDLRLENQDRLDELLNKATRHCQPYDLMETLQHAGVPAGVCQTAEDRYDTDPQLRHLEWLVDLRQSEIGTWPAREFPVQFSETPAYMGGQIDRHGPNYGEDNGYVLGELLGLSQSEIDELSVLGVT